jgi:uncharacterized membrane protein YfcA
MCSAGSIVGIPVGIHFSAVLPASFVKMFFLSAWLSFAVALIWINRHSSRPVHLKIRNDSLTTRIELLTAGILGGIMTGMTGCGVNVLILMLLILSLHISEKVAVPTAVVMAAISSMAGVIWLYFFNYPILPQAWEFWWVSVPIVIMGAPAGSRFAKACPRLVISRFIFAAIVIEFCAGFILIRQTKQLLVFSMLVFAAGLLTLFWLIYRGRQIQVDLLPGNLD